MWWFRRKRRITDDDTPSEELVQLRADRLEAEAKLEETRNMGPAVTQLSSRMRQLRANNHFSARIAEAFGRLHD